MITPCPAPTCATPVRFADTVPAGTVQACPGCGGGVPAPAELTFVVYDLETTGLSADGCEIIQIAATRLVAGRVRSEDAFFSYCRPQQAIPRFITEYTGVTDRDVRDAPRPIQALEAFSRYVGHSVLMAHNGHRFDLKFLEATATRHRVPTRPVESLDTIALSKRVFGTKPGTGHSLDRVMSRLGVSVGDHRRHDARGDVAALAAAVALMWDRLALDARATTFPRRETFLPAV